MQTTLTVESAEAREARVAYQDGIASKAAANAAETRRLIGLSGKDLTAHCASLGVNAKAKDAIAQCAAITHPYRRY